MIAITFDEAFQVGTSLAAVYGLVAGVILLIVMVSYPAPSIGVIGTAITTLSLIALGVGPAPIVATATVIAVAMMAGIAFFLPQRLEEASELAGSDEVPMAQPAQTH